MVARRLLAPALIAAAVAAAAEDGPSPTTEDAARDLAIAVQRMLDALMAQTRPWADALDEVLRNPEAFEAPERLPNGDIIIRRRTPDDDVDL